MKTPMKTTFLAASVVALGLLSYPLLSQAFDDSLGTLPQRAAQDCPRADGEYARHAWESLANRLNLSPEQRQSTRSIEEKYLPKLRDIRKSLMEGRQALAKVAVTDPKLQELAAAQGKAMADMIVLRKQMRAEMSQVLTEEQRQSLDKLIGQRGRHQRSNRDQ